MPRRATTFILLLIAASALALVISGCPGPSTDATPSPEPTASPQSGDNPPSVVLTGLGDYYNVTLDYSSGVSRRTMGKLLGTAIQGESSLSSYPSLLDSYIYDSVNLLAGGNATARGILYTEAIRRVDDIIIPQEFKEEIEGLASALCDAETNDLGDGDLSKDELYLLQLILDVGKTSQCSAVSVFGAKSETGHTITGRVLDWYSGDSGQLPKIQAVTTIKDGDKSIVMIGYLGLMSGLTLVNDDKVFAAILESSTSATTAETAGKRSYSMDLRYAMENFTTMADVSDFMISKPYVAGHLILLSDPDTSKVLENDIGAGRHRALRTSASPLNAGIGWGISDAIGCVNSFVLEGNHNNHTGNDSNRNRWSSIISQLTLRGDDVTNAGITAIVSYFTGSEPGSLSIGDLYNISTQQIVVIEPGTLAVKIFFRPKDGILPTSPVFETVPISF